MTAGNGVSGFDLADLTTVETIEHVVLSPRDGQPIISYGQPWTVTLAGPGHPATLGADAGRYRAMIELGAVYGDGPLPPEEAAKVVRRSVAERMIAWTPVDFQGELKIDCTPENAEKMLTTARWLYDAMTLAMERRAAFLAPLPDVPATTPGTSNGSAAKTKKARASRHTGERLRAKAGRPEKSSAPS